MRIPIAAALLLAGGCMQPGSYQGGGGYNPAPAPAVADLSGTWHLESTDDGTGRGGKGVVQISQIGGFVTARVTPSGGGTDITMTGTLGGDGFLQANYWVTAGGQNRQATLSGQVVSRAEISGRWTVPGHSTGTFRWLR